MPSKAKKYVVIAIPPDRLADIWDQVGGWLLKGQLEETPDLQTAISILGCLIIKVHERKAHVWAVIDDEGRRVVAAMLSQVIADEGKRVVHVSRMSGEGITRWGAELSRTINNYAKTESADVVRFYGRRALQRCYQGAKIVSRHTHNTYLYEGIPA